MQSDIKWFYKILVLVCIWCLLLMICIQFICRQLSSVFWHLLQFKLKLYNLSKQTYMKATTDIHKESPRGTASGMSRCHFFGWLLMSLLSFYHVQYLCKTKYLQYCRTGVKRPNETTAVWEVRSEKPSGGKLALKKKYQYYQVTLKIGANRTKVNNHRNCSFKCMCNHFNDNYCVHILYVILSNFEDSN